MTELIREQGALIDRYNELAQPEHCIDCEARLDGPDLKSHWDYCEFCGESICHACDTLHACEAMRRARPTARRR